jgi:hypothetical protein
MLATEMKKLIPLKIHSHSIIVVSLGLLGACSQVMSGDPMVFKCDSSSPPFDKGETFMIKITPGSYSVERGQYRFNVDPLPKAKRQQGWRRWITNAGADGISNSWNELNIKTGELRYIGINGQVESLVRCLQEK